MKLLILLFIIKNYQLLLGAIYHEYYENDEYFYDYDIKGERIFLGDQDEKKSFYSLMFLLSKILPKLLEIILYYKEIIISKFIDKLELLVLWFI